MSHRSCPAAARPGCCCDTRIALRFKLKPWPGSAAAGPGPQGLGLSRTGLIRRRPTYSLFRVHRRSRRNRRDDSNTAGPGGGEPPAPRPRPSPSLTRNRADRLPSPASGNRPQQTRTRQVSRAGPIECPRARMPPTRNRCCLTVAWAGRHVTNLGPRCDCDGPLVRSQRSSSGGREPGKQPCGPN